MDSSQAEEPGGSRRSGTATRRLAVYCSAEAHYSVTRAAELLGIGSDFDGITSWPVGLAAGAIWLLVAGVARMSSLASLASFAAAPCFALVLEEFAVVKLAFTIAVLVFVRHQGNIRRLLAGTEPRIGRGNAERA